MRLPWALYVSAIPFFTPRHRRPGAVQRDTVIRRAERGNAAAWSAYAGVQSLGTPFLAPDLINTVLIRLGASDFVLGLFALNQLLSLPAQLLAARLTDRSRHKVRLAWFAVIGAVVPVLLPASVLWATAGRLSLWSFFAAAFGYYLLSGLCGAFGGVVQMDLLSRVFRPGRRGTILGLQGSIAGLAGAVGGLAVAGLVGRLAYPHGYVLSWAAGLTLVVLASLSLLRLRQLPGLGPARGRPALDLRAALDLLRRDRRFLVFLVAVVARMGFSAAQYYLWPTARRLHGLPDEYVGYLVTTSSVVSMVCSPLIGWLADRAGRAATGLGFAAAAIAGFVAFSNAESTATLLAAYVLVVVGTSGIAMPLFLSVLDLSPPELRGTYVAARYGLESVAYAVFLPGFGYASSRLAPHVVFYAAAALCAVAGVVLYRVAEGRGRAERR